jgi:26S proteasome regulatory subunit N9
MVMDIDTIPNHLADQRDAAPDELQHYFLQFEDYWERKLWHELTDSLIKYFEEPASVSQRLPLYNVFIKSFADKINKLKLVTLGLSAAPQSKGTDSALTSRSKLTGALDDQQRLVFVRELAEKANTPASQDAYVFATVELARILLQNGKSEEAQKKLNECEKILESFDAVETVVHAAFYKANAEYYKVHWPIARQCED